MRALAHVDDILQMHLVYHLEKGHYRDRSELAGNKVEDRCIRSVFMFARLGSEWIRIAIMDGESPNMFVIFHLSYHIVRRFVWDWRWGEPVKNNE